MRCLNEDEKEQYKGDKNIITANLIADEKPETFPFNGGPVSNLTENDVLAPGSTLMILDGSGEIYMMKEENFCPNYGELDGYYEITARSSEVTRPDAGHMNGDTIVKYYDRNGNLLDSATFVSGADTGGVHTPATFHDLYIRRPYDSTSLSDYTSCEISVASNSANTLKYNNNNFVAGDVIYNPDYYYIAGKGTETIRVDIISAQTENAWCKL